MVRSAEDVNRRSASIPPYGAAENARDGDLDRPLADLAKALGIFAERSIKELVACALRK